jgi:hypothetical protein
VCNQFKKLPIERRECRTQFIQIHIKESPMFPIDTANILI